MSNQQGQFSQNGGFNALNLFQQSTNQHAEQGETNGTSDRSGRVPHFSYQPAATTTSGTVLGTTRTEDGGLGRQLNGVKAQQQQQQQQQVQQQQSQQKPQSHQQQTQQQPQQPQQQQQTLQCHPTLQDVTRNQLLSLALTGDLAKAIQLANIGVPQWNGANLNVADANNAVSLGVNQSLQELGLQRLQEISRGNNHLETLGLQQQSRTQEQSSTDTGQPQRNLSASSTPNVTEQPEKKVPRSVAVPCRARGMSIEHNFQSAYFVIREDIKHGEGLICSFPACRNRGVKFLFCAYCRDPVAKRNFRNRHSHTEEQDDARKVTDDSVTQPSTSASLTNPQASTDDDIEENEENRVSSSSSQQNAASSASDSVSGQHEVSSKKRSHAEIQNSTDKSSKGNDSQGAKPAKLDTREEVWAFLLSKRPRTDKGDEMSAWLMQVMAVSDGKKSLAEVSSYMNSGFNSKYKVEDQLTDEGSDKSSSLGGDTNDSYKSSSLEGDAHDSYKSSLTGDNDSSTVTGGVNGSTESAPPTESASSATPTGGSSNDSSTDSFSENQEAVNDYASETQD